MTHVDGVAKIAVKHNLLKTVDHSKSHQTVNIIIKKCNISEQPYPQTKHHAQMFQLTAHSVLLGPHKEPSGNMNS